MKNLLSVALVVFLFGAFTSCKKDYVCTCEVSVLGISQSTSTTFTDVSKSDAEAACEKAETDATVVGVTVTCSLD